MYYNPESGEKLSRKDLCVLTNISIPEGTEELSGWYKLTYADMPEQDPAFIVEQGPVELVDGHYVQTYNKRLKSLFSNMNIVKFLEK